MNARWQFRKFRPGDRARNSQVEKFFHSDDVEGDTNAVVREGIQNSLDAALRDQASGLKSVNVRILFGKSNADQLDPFISGLSPHLHAVHGKIPQIPALSGEFRYLVFEDFNTSGLKGDPDQWEPPEDNENAFFNFFRGEGVTSKTEHQRGRHGVGKMVFTIARKARVIFGVTATESSGPMLMGTSTLIQHRVDGNAWHPDGWFGEIRETESSPLVVPVRTPQVVEQFSDLFQLERESLPGLSVVVPWLVDSVTAEAAVLSVVKGFFWPILQNRLTVELISDDGKPAVINSGNLLSMAEAVSGTTHQTRNEIGESIDLAIWAKQLHPSQIVVAALPPGNAQNWSDDLLTSEQVSLVRNTLAQGQSIALKLPVKVRQKTKKEAEESELFVYLRPDAGCQDGKVQFVRDGLLISGVRSRRCPGYRALVIIEDGPLATFLGDAENPSHTEWQKENLRDKYSFHDSCLKFVVQAVPAILKTLHQDHQTADQTLLLDLFSLPGEDTTWPPAKSGGKKPKGGGKNEPPNPLPPPPPPRYSLQKTEGGFRVCKGHQDASLPEIIKLRVAYDVRKGNPLKKYTTDDFDFSGSQIGIALEGCRELERQTNSLKVDVEDEDFEIRMTGFDTNRDLHIKVDISTRPEEVIDGSQA